MKIVFLNVWHGGVWEDLQKFILDQENSTDLFCFTEVDPELQSKFIKILPNFNSTYDEIMETNYLNGGMDGQSIFVKKGIKIERVEKKSIFNITADDAGIMQIIEVNINNVKMTIGSAHGMAKPGEKLDTPARIKQSKNIIEAFKDKSGLKIIGGDLNLYPETESIKMFEQEGYKNLIKDYGVKNTRNRLSWEHFKNIQYFADYCFVSEGVKVKSFTVPEVEVSDHLPLILNIEV